MSLFSPRSLALGVVGAATLALGGCYDDGYGYSGVSVGVGTGYYGAPYGYGGYGGYGYGDPYYASGYGYGYPAYGWYDGFYYPGNGFYVYDQGGRRFRMRDRDRQHWQGGERQAGNWPGRNGQPGMRPGGRPGDSRGNGRVTLPPGSPFPNRGWQVRGDQQGAGRPQQGTGGRAAGRDGGANRQGGQPGAGNRSFQAPRAPAGAGGARSFNNGTPVTRGRGRSR